MNTLLIVLGILFVVIVIVFGYRDDFQRNPKKFIRTFGMVFFLIVFFYSLFWFSLTWMK